MTIPQYQIWETCQTLAQAKEMQREQFQTFSANVITKLFHHIARDTKVPDGYYDLMNMITVAQAVKEYCISAGMIRNWLERGYLKHIKVDTLTYIFIDSLEEHLNNNGYLTELDDNYISVADAAAIYGAPAYLLHNAHKAGLISAKKYGNTKMLLIAELEKYLSTLNNPTFHRRRSEG